MIRSENYIRSLLIIFFSHKRMMISLTFFFWFLTLLVALLFPPIYNINGKLIVKSKKIQVPPESIALAGYKGGVLPPSREDVISEIEIITSHDLIFQSIEKLEKKGHAITGKPFFLIRFLDDYFLRPLTQRIILPINQQIIIPLLNWLDLELNSEEQTELEARTKEIKDIIEAVVLPGSNVINVSFMYGDPYVGADILNSIFENYLPFRLSLFTNPFQSDFFSEQIRSNLSGMSRLQKSKLEILNSLDVSDIEKEIDIQMSLSEKLRRDIQTLEKEKEEKSLDVKTISRLFENYSSDRSVFKPFPYDFQDSEINRYTERLSALIFDYHENLRIFHKTTDKIQVLEYEIKELKSVYTHMISNRLKQEKENLKLIQKIIQGKRKELDLLNQRNQKLKAAGIRIQQLDIEFDILSENYQTFFRKAEEFKMVRNSELSQLSNVQIISYATAPDKPFFPKKETGRSHWIRSKSSAQFITDLHMGFFSIILSKHRSKFGGSLMWPVIGYMLHRKKYIE